MESNNLNKNIPSIEKDDLYTIDATFNMVPSAFFDISTTLMDPGQSTTNEELQKLEDMVICPKINRDMASYKNIIEDTSVIINEDELTYNIQLNKDIIFKYRWFTATKNDIEFYTIYKYINISTFKNFVTTISTIKSIYPDEHNEMLNLMDSIDRPIGIIVVSNDHLKSITKENEVIYRIVLSFMPIHKGIWISIHENKGFFKIRKNLMNDSNFMLCLPAFSFIMQDVLPFPSNYFMRNKLIRPDDAIVTMFDFVHTYYLYHFQPIIKKFYNIDDKDFQDLNTYVSGYIIHDTDFMDFLTWVNATDCDGSCKKSQICPKCEWSLYKQKYINYTLFINNEFKTLKGNRIVDDNDKEYETIEAKTLTFNDVWKRSTCLLCGFPYELLKVNSDNSYENGLNPFKEASDINTDNINLLYGQILMRGVHTYSALCNEIPYKIFMQANFTSLDNRQALSGDIFHVVTNSFASKNNNHIKRLYGPIENIRVFFQILLRAYPNCSITERMFSCMFESFNCNEHLNAAIKSKCLKEPNFFLSKEFKHLKKLQNVADLLIKTSNDSESYRVIIQRDLNCIVTDIVMDHNLLWLDHNKKNILSISNPLNYHDNIFEVMKTSEQQYEALHPRKSNKIKRNRYDSGSDGTIDYDSL
jgi:hypothetical protein